MLKKLIGKSLLSLVVVSALMLMAGTVCSAASLCTVYGSKEGKNGYSTIVNKADNTRYYAVAVYGTAFNEAKNGTQLASATGTLSSGGSKTVHANISSYAHAYAGGSIYNSCVYASHIAESRVAIIK